MTSIFDQLNLRPQERRLVMGLMLVAFFVLNFFLVWPQFKEWSKVEAEFKKVGQQLEMYETEAAKIPASNKTLAELQAQGSDVLPAEQAIQLSRTVQSIANKSKVSIRNIGRVNKTMGSTNLFFNEQEMPLDVEAKEPEMVDLLVLLASDNSLIRVKGLTLRPSPNQQVLVGQLRLVASYQKDDK